MLLIGVLVVPPIVMLALGAFRSGPPGAPFTWTVDSFRTVFSDRRTLEIGKNSVLLAFWVSALSLVLGTTLGWLVTRSDLPWRRTLSIGIIAPFFVPGAITAVAWASLGNPSNGLLNDYLDKVGLSVNVYGLPGIVFVETLYGMPLVFLAATAAFANMDASLEEAAMANGASRFRAVALVSIPLVRPAVIGMTALLFLRMLAAFEVPFILGTPAKIEVFSSAIFTAIYQRTPARYDVASALGVVLMITTVGALVVLRRLNAARAYETLRGKGHQVHPVRLGRLRWPMFAVVTAYVAIAAGLPLFTIVAASFSRSGRVSQLGNWTTDNFDRVLDSPTVVDGARTTLELAILVGLLATAIATVGVYTASHARGPAGRAIAGLLDLPVAIPGAVLGLALLWTWLPIQHPIDLYGTVTLLVLGYLLVAFPVATRVISGGVVQLHPELEESALVHGANRWRSFRSVAVPMLTPGILVAFFLTSLVVLKEAATAAMLATRDSTVLPVLILDYWRSGDTPSVMVMSTLLLIVVAILLVVQRLLALVLHQLERR